MAAGTTTAGTCDTPMKHFGFFHCFAETLTLRQPKTADTENRRTLGFDLSSEFEA